MRRIRHLDFCDYVIPLKQGHNQVLSLSNNQNILLKRTWHNDKAIEFNVHAKFNADLMNGVQFYASMERYRALSFSITSANLYVVDDADWSETLVAPVLFSLDAGGFYYGSISQVTLGANELSGREVYRLGLEASRGRKKYSKSIWFNHLGVFDSVNRLRVKSDYLKIVKADT